MQNFFEAIQEIIGEKLPKLSIWFEKELSQVDKSINYIGSDLMRFELIKDIVIAIREFQTTKRIRLEIIDTRFVLKSLAKLKWYDSSSIEIKDMFKRMHKWEQDFY